MAIPAKVGAHWALVEVDEAPGGGKWVSRWAIYADEGSALRAAHPSPVNAVVSGSTGVFESRADALLKGAEDATRTEEVLSGTYRERTVRA